MSRFVRQSKYRHVFGQPAKKEHHFDNIKVSANAWDTDLVAVNPKYIAVNYQVSGGGAFIVVPLEKAGRLPDIYPLVRAHAAPVLDTAWNPFDDAIIASAGEDSRVQITRIDDALLEAAYIEGAEVEDLKPLPTNMSHGGRKVGHVKWHPTASGILASAAADVKLWDVEKQTPTIELDAHPDLVQSMCFNQTGALLATACKDKKLRLFDVRASNSPIKITESHTGIKGSRVCWLGGLDRIATTGFSRMSDRQLFLWDAGNLDKPIKQITVDTSSGTLMPFWSDNNVLFVAGKGDGNCRYYEYENDDLVYLTEFKSSEPQRGMTFLPRRGLNVADCEIARGYKVAGTSVEPISYIVPRKSDSFQSDIFPPAPSAEPAMSAADFFNGKTSGPILLDMDSRQTSASPAKAYTPMSASKQSSTPSTPSAPQEARKQPSVASLRTNSAAKPQEQITKSPVSVSPQASISTPRQDSSRQDSSRQESTKQDSSSFAPSPKTAEPSPLETPSTKANGQDQLETMKARVAELEQQLDERDAIIRTLELKVEKMTHVYKQAQDAFAAVSV